MDNENIHEEKNVNEKQVNLSDEFINEEKSCKEQKTSKNELKSKWIIFVMGILFALTIGFCMGTIRSQQEGDNLENKSSNEYANIIKTVSSSATGELSIKDIAKLTANSVVEITTETVVRGSILGQYVYEGAGSGVIIASDGYIVTNNHVIEGASKIMIKLKNDETHEATVVGRSNDFDIAVLKIDAVDLQPVVIGDSSKLVVGDTAVVVGNPLGSGATVTNGIISALDREIDLGDCVMNLMQTNAAVNPGNSGGGLFNGYGELVGIVVAKSAGTDIEGIGFAIPINDIREIISEIKTFGYIRGRVQLGVNLLEVDNTWDAMIYGLDSLGVYVKSVEEGSDAQKAGVRSGDRVVSINGRKVNKAEDIKNEVITKSPKDKVVLGIIRNGREYNVNIVLSEYKGQ